MTSYLTVPNPSKSTADHIPVVDSPTPQHTSCKTSHTRRLTIRKSLLKRRTNLRAKKLCPDCGKSEPKQNHTLCQSCLRSRATSEAARRLRLKAVQA